MGRRTRGRRPTSRNKRVYDEEARGWSSRRTARRTATTTRMTGRGERRRPTDCSKKEGDEADGIDDQPEDEVDEEEKDEKDGEGSRGRCSSTIAEENGDVDEVTGKGTTTTCR